MLWCFDTEIFQEEDENNWSDDDASEGSRDGTESHRSAVPSSVGRGGRGDNGGKSSGNKVNSVRCGVTITYFGVFVLEAKQTFFFVRFFVRFCR